MNAAMPDTLLMLLLTVVLTAIGLILTLGFVYAIDFLLTLPMRRAERARLFLDLLEIGFGKGQTPEETIESAAASHDLSTGARFHLVAEHIAHGRSLVEALRCVPRFLPPRVMAMLAAGAHAGNLRAMLPACRTALAGGSSSTRSAQNYLVLLVFAFTPIALVTPFFIGRVILPKFQEVFASLAEGAALPAFTRLILGASGSLILVQAGLILVLWVALFFYLGGPRIRLWTSPAAPILTGALALAVPWERLRMRRDFSKCLTVLLDAGVPELQAISLAADCTDNAVLTRRAAEAAARVRQGVPFPEALAAVDSSGELKWRLRNAARSGKPFAPALEGWHETLEARAFQVQQAFAQVATTAMVLLNGVIVGAIVIAMFLPLIDLNERLTVW